MSGTHQTTAPARRRGWLWLLLAIALAAGVYGYFMRSAAVPEASTGKRGAGAAGRAVPVMTEVARKGDVSVYLDGLGTVSALNTVTVRPRVDGQLMKVLFVEGQWVKAGEVLAEIDPRPFQVQLAQAQGQMARDQALLKNAKIDLERFRTLYAQDSIAKQELDTQAALVRQYEAAIKVDQAQIDSAKLQLTYARVTAPISGRVGLRQVDPGNVVHATDTAGLVVITQLQPAAVIFPLPQDSLPQVLKKLSAGEKLPVDAYDREGKLKLDSGRLLTTDNEIDPATGTVKLKAQFPNTEGTLFPNQFVNVRMLVERHARRDARSRGRGAARQRRQLRLHHQGRRHGERAHRQARTGRGCQRRGRQRHRARRPGSRGWCGQAARRRQGGIGAQERPGTSGRPARAQARGPAPRWRGCCTRSQLT